LLDRKSKIYRATARVFRNTVINPVNRRRLKNHDFTILSNNCTGGLISHDLGKRFLSPTVNLFIKAPDFVKFLSNLDHYLKQEIVEIHKEGISYPVGKLDDIEIYFMHYKDINEAREKWYERSKRINYDNIFIIMVDDNRCTKETIKQFEQLPYKNKVFLTNKRYKNCKTAYYIKGFENKEYIEDITMYKNIFGQKYYDNFDYVSWLNKGK